jgi:DNA polymerase-3 subunit delta'
LQARRQERTGQAYLFTGDEVAFLAGFARAWIQACACPCPTAEGDACGNCAACQSLAGRSYPELHELHPQSKARFIVVDEVRAMEHYLGLTPGPGRRKFGLIIEADRMTEQAQNAFLKTLEEPTPRTMLVLVSAQPRALLPTIRSRCQVVSLLQNRRSYETAIHSGVIAAIAPLRRNAGAATALAAAAGLNRVFAQLAGQATQAVGEQHDARWEVLAQQDKTLKKRLDEERQEQTAAEYLRLRQMALDAIQTWFQQQFLLAAGVAHEQLPHPEFLEAAAVTCPDAGVPLDAAQAEDDTRSVADLLRYLSGNVQEQLALEAFCLAVCGKSS